MTGSAWRSICLHSALATLALGTQGCYIYSAFQGARTLDQGRFSVSPSVSVVSYSQDGETDRMTTQYGARGAVGLGHRLELQTRYERVSPREDDLADVDGYNYLDFGFKYGIIQDILAVGMPIGFMFGENVDEEESWQLHPSLYLTAPVAPFLDINFSTKALYFLDEPLKDLLWAFNGGFGIRPGDGRFSLLPEMGILFNPGEEGAFWNWGVGASAEF